MMRIWHFQVATWSTSLEMTSNILKGTDEIKEQYLSVVLDDNKRNYKQQKWLEVRKTRQTGVRKTNISTKEFFLSKNSFFFSLISLHLRLNDHIRKQASRKK